jgi:hypothetical protein
MMDVVSYADQLRRSWEWNKGRAVRRRKHHAESECFGDVARSFAKNSFSRHDRLCLFLVGLDSVSRLISLQAAHKRGDKLRYLGFEGSAKKAICLPARAPQQFILKQPRRLSFAFQSIACHLSFRTRQTTRPSV